MENEGRELHTSQSLPNCDRQCTKANRPETPEVVDSHRLQQTVNLCICMLGVGLIGVIEGTTLVHIGLLYGTTPGRISLAMMLEGVGLFIGSFMCTKLIRRLSVEVISLPCVVSASALTAVAPFIPSLAAFIGAMALRGLACGCFILLSQAYVIDVWSGHRCREPLIQTIHAMYAVGATVSPFIIKQFLIELDSDDKRFQIYSTITAATPLNDSTQNVNNQTVFYSITNNTHQLLSPKHDDVDFVANNDTMFASDLPEGLLLVRFSYLATGLTSLLTTLPTFGLFFYKCLKPRADHDLDSAENNRNSSALNACDVDDEERPSSPDTSVPSKNWTIIYTAVVVILTFFYCGLEITGRSFFTPFAICYLSWPVGDAALLTSSLYVTFTVARLIGIPIAAHVRPLVLFIIDLLILIVGYSLLLLPLVIENLSSSVVWLSSGIIALGLSTAYSSLVFVNAGGPEAQLVGRRGNGGKTSAVVLHAMMVGGNVGLSLFPLAVGSLFDNVSPMWVVYLPLVTIVCIAFMLVIKRAVTRPILRVSLRPPGRHQIEHIDDTYVSPEPKPSMLTAVTQT